MVLFVIDVEKNMMKIFRKERLTSGASKAFLVKFRFSPEWEDLARVAVFRSGRTVIDVLLDRSNICFIPWEVLVEHGTPIDIGVYGTIGEDIVLPTIWTSTDNVLEGVVTNLGEDPVPPSPDILEQLLARLDILEKLESLADLAPLTNIELEEILT